MATVWTFIACLFCICSTGHASGENLISSTEIAKSPEQIPQTLMELNSCFRYVPEIRLKISSEHIGGTESIQFKDECLKLCLRSMIQKNFVCRSLMHIPSDDDCLLTTTDMKHAQYEQTNEYPQTNYYENICAENPYGSTGTISEAKFNSFRGGDGMLQVVQKYGQPTKALFIIDGLHENTKIQIRHYPKNVEDCYKLKKGDVAQSKPLFEAKTDYAGSAVMAWRDIELESNNANILETWILVIEGDHDIVECGKVHLGLDNSGHTENGADSIVNFSFIFVLLATYITALYL